MGKIFVPHELKTIEIDAEKKYSALMVKTLEKIVTDLRSTAADTMILICVLK